MSGTLEVECMAVKWKGRVAEPDDSDTASPTFQLFEDDWRMKCGEYDDGDIRLFLVSVLISSSFPTSFHAFVRVEDSRGKEFSQMTVEVRKGTNVRKIWCQKVQDVERLVPEFHPNRQLTFRLTIVMQKDPQNTTTTQYDNTKCTFCGFSNQAESTATASVQTSLDVSTLPCLVSLSEDLAKLLDLQESDPDVEFQCSELTTKAHRAVVTARSPVLAKMLKADMVEGRTGVAKIQDMSADTFKQFLRYLYTGQLEELTFDSAVLLFEAGDQFKVSGLVNRCSEFIVSNLSEANAYDVLVVADAHSNSKLVEAIVHFIIRNKFPISSDRWSKFSDEQPKLANKVLNQFCQKFAKKLMERED